ncbi:hypothetical protein DQ04_06961040 [Trypanosoma grayi]|uniref:hypothetical protein n=1 Tax=Trypanosoma grayi TaxID=71804 RepID=UPI0004F46A4C|nr:hypothetical protein DQ04_06961040 [Trypanosoma grayi]KEG08540.1 hypothetical protein DQ04_06961040 [Trypanosoma grayi]
MNSSAERKLLIPRRAARQEDHHHCCNQQKNETNRSTTFGSGGAGSYESSPLGDEVDSDDEAEAGEKSCCGRVQTGFSLLYGVTLQPLLARLTPRRVHQIGQHPLEDNENNKKYNNDVSISSPTTNNTEVSGGNGLSSVVEPGGRVTFNPPRARHERAPLSPNSAGDSTSTREFAGAATVKPDAVSAVASRSVQGGANRAVRPADCCDTTTTELLRAIESERVPLRTLGQLASVVERFAEFLPVRIEVEEERRNVTSSSSSLSSSCQVCVEVLGPLHATPNAAALGLLEDILLEDCVAGCLSITCIHFADIVFSGDAASGVQSATRVESNGYLDVLPSLGFSVDRGTRCGTADAGAMLKECCERVCAFAKNMLECCSCVDTVHLTRCSFTPSDLGRGLTLPILRLRRLLFESCPLSAAHVVAFVRLAKTENKRGGEVRALENLVELQLSGSLTEEALNALLSYFNDDLFDSEVSLTTLRLPTLWARVARSHPLLERHPLLVITGT